MTTTILLICPLILWVRNLDRASLGDFLVPLALTKITQWCSASDWTELKLKTNSWCLSREGWNARLSGTTPGSLIASPRDLCNRVVTLLTQWLRAPRDQVSTCQFP